MSCLQSHRRSHVYESASFLVTVLMDAVKNNPNDHDFLKQLIDLNAIGIRSIRIRQFLNADVEGKLLTAAFFATNPYFFSLSFLIFP